MWDEYIEQLGEIESRDAIYRMNFNKEQRKKNLPLSVALHKHSVELGDTKVLFSNGGTADENKLVPVKIMTSPSDKYHFIEVSDYLTDSEVKNVVSGKYPDYTYFPILNIRASRIQTLTGSRSARIPVKVINICAKPDQINIFALQ